MALFMGAEIGHELFDYNRENFQFDTMQRLLCDLTRLEMQIKRFELFREDIRDLVELTVGKMDMYHLVGALFLEFCVAFYVEGKIETVEVPPFSIALYYLSVAGAFLYLVLAVWLSMHASISSHSFGVRLLTRYVRLPIPSAQQMKEMNPMLHEFERMGLKAVGRIPFLQGPQDWKHRQVGAGLAAVPEEAAAQPAISQNPGGSVPDLLGGGEAPFSKDVLRAADLSAGAEHVVEFRKLQERWQSFDAYARVSMSLGAAMLVQSINFYLINVCLVEYRSLTACWALILVFQCLQLGIFFLDLSATRPRRIFLVQLFSLLPVVIAAACLFTAIRSSNGSLGPSHDYSMAPLCFGFTVVWLECMLHLAWPGADEATLPRRFRAVLFLDVFGDSQLGDVATPPDGSKDEVVPSTSKLEQADEACDVAHQALRRWETLPDMVEFQEAHLQIKALRREFNFWRKALANEIRRRVHDAEVSPDQFFDEAYYAKGQADLTDEEQQLDVFGGATPRLVGPVQARRQGGIVQNVYFSSERRAFVAESDRHSYGEPLPLQEVNQHCADFELAVRSAIGDKNAKHTQDLIESDAEYSDSEDPDLVKARYQCMSNMRFVCCPKATLLERQRKLPWTMLRFATRCLQFAWAFQGVVFLGQELGYFQIDHMRELSGRKDSADNLDGRRRLQQAPWCFKPVETQWPRGDFFRPEGPLSCLPGGSGLGVSDGNASLVILSSAHQAYAAEVGFASNLGMPRSETPLQLRPLPRSRFPPGSAAVCASSASKSAAPTSQTTGSWCVVATPREDSTVEIWPFGDAEREQFIRLAVEKATGRNAWRMLAGAVVRCQAAAGMLVDAPDTQEDENSWCMLLAGWDGGPHISVAAIPLSGQPGSMPQSGTTITPVFDVPLHRSSWIGSSSGNGQVDTFDKRSGTETAADLVAMHMEPESGRGRLWALLADGTLQVWEVASPARAIGSWQVDFLARDGISDDLHQDVSNGLLQASGLCEMRGATPPLFSTVVSRLVVVGRSVTGGPTLLSAEIPDLASHDTRSVASQ